MAAVVAVAEPERAAKIVLATTERIPRLPFILPNAMVAMSTSFFEMPP